MPTKERKQREAEKRQQAEQEAAELAEFDRQMAALSPEHLAALRALGSDSNDLVFELPPYMRMKGGLIGFDEEGNVWKSGSIGVGGNLKRANDAQDEAEDLRRRYSAIWGKRGRAKTIAYETGLPVETIRRYFKRVP